MLVMGFDGSRSGCGQTHVDFLRVGSDERFAVEALEDSPGVLIVRPGKYYPVYAYCTGPEWSYTLPGIANWVLPVDVKEREIIYLGAFTPAIVDVKTDNPVLFQALEAVFTFGASLLRNDGAIHHQYPTYQFGDQLEADRGALREDLGALVDKIIDRRFTHALSPEAVENAYLRAYQAKPDGTLPSTKEAQTKLEAELQQAMLESVRLLSSSAPDSPPIQASDRLEPASMAAPTQSSKN